MLYSFHHYHERTDIMEITKNILFLPAVCRETPRIPDFVQSAFDIFYTQYLDMPGREKRFNSIGRVRLSNDRYMNYAFIRPITEEFIADCYAAGSSLLMDTALLPYQNGEARRYIKDRQTAMPRILHSHLSNIHPVPGYQNKRESIRNAAYDFLYEISRTAYYEASKDIFKRISA